MWIRKHKNEKSEVSINDPLGTDKEGNEICFNDILPADGAAIAEDFELKMDILELYEMIDRVLNTREKEIIINRFGLYCRKPLTQREVAENMNISRSYVSRIRYGKQTVCCCRYFICLLYFILLNREQLHHCEAEECLQGTEV